MSMEWNCHGIMAFWWYRKCQGRDKTFIFKALDNHLWIVSFHQVFISNRPIIDMDVIIFLDGFDILSHGLVHSVQSLSGYSFTGHQNEIFIVYFLQSEFWVSVIFSLNSKCSSIYFVPLSIKFSTLVYHQGDHRVSVCLKWGYSRKLKPWTCGHPSDITINSGIC